MLGQVDQELVGILAGVTGEKSNCAKLINEQRRSGVVGKLLKAGV